MEDLKASCTYALVLIRGIKMKKISLKRLFLFLLFFSHLHFAFASAGGGSSATSKYFSLSPPMVVNIIDKGKVRHLQVNIQLRLDDPADTPVVQEHKPAIQHELVMLLSGREAKNIRSTKGKEKLRAEATEKLKQVLTENIGKPTINAVYFTTFVIQ